MTDTTRWTIRVPAQTDAAVRDLLAARGRRRGDLRRFVEEAVLREVLRETVHEPRPHRPDLELEAMMRLLDRELAGVRRREAAS